jgi:hypothetical protein
MPDITEITGIQGISTEYKFTLASEPDKLLAELVGDNPEDSENLESGGEDQDGTGEEGNGDGGTGEEGNGDGGTGEEGNGDGGTGEEGNGDGGTGEEGNGDGGTGEEGNGDGGTGEEGTGGPGGGDLSITVTSRGTLREQTKALLEGSLAATAFINDMVDGAADGRVFNSVQNGGIFCFVSDGKSRHTNGSHVDFRDFSAVIGAGKGFELSRVKLTSVIFAEGGAGRYKSFNSFSTGDVKGRGDVRGLGGGIFARLDGNGSGNGHLYGEGSAHGGKIKHDFSTNDMADFRGVRAKYSSESTYFGFHGGGGYIYEIGNGIFLDAYAKYIWTQKNGKDVILSTGETVRLEDVNSKRLLSGLKLSRKTSSGTALYIGGACHYEFGGEVNGSINGLNIDASSLRGASAVMELGITGNWNSLSFDFGTHGYLGKRRGFDAFLDIKYMF